MYDIEYFYQASDVQDAVRALQEKEGAQIISGGTDVLIKVREGKMAGASLVSIHGLKELTGIRMEEDGTIVIGPGSSFSAVHEDPIVREHLQMLSEAVNQVGSPQIRNMGTIGGNVCNGVTSADSASSLWAYNAVLELTGPDGVRRVPIREFYTGPGKTVRVRCEVLTAIRISRENYEGYFGKYIKYGKRNAMEIATLGCACLVRLSQDKTKLEDIRIAYGVAAPTPMRCLQAESSLAGREVLPSLADEIVPLVLEEIHPRDSWRASKAFRIQIAGEMIRRAFRAAAGRAGARGFDQEGSVQTC